MEEKEGFWVYFTFVIIVIITVLITVFIFCPIQRKIKYGTPMSTTRSRIIEIYKEDFTK